MGAQACIERITELVQPERLRHELERAFGGAVPRDAVVGLRCGSRSACVASEEGTAWSAPGPVRVRVGCIAKLLTAILARRAFETRRLAPDEHVSDLLSAGSARGALRGITLRQLLEHTHGLDDSMLLGAPRDSLGRIDTEALAREVRAAPPLAMPGALYSYGNAGALVVAALLERLASRPYTALLAEALESLGVGVGVVGSADVICPATGGELALDPSVFLDLVAQATFPAPHVWPDDESAGEYGFATRLPGWNPLERGIYLGWKYHGAGWLGHQSVWPGHSVLVRAHPRRQLALVAAGGAHSAAVLAARVFGAHLPELFEIKPPARSTATPELPVGTFGSVAWRVYIRKIGDELELRARRNDDSVESSATLRALAPGLWLTRPVLSAFPHVELVKTPRAYLWNGRFVLPRFVALRACPGSIGS